jgi:hypothetical protein
MSDTAVLLLMLLHAFAVRPGMLHVKVMGPGSSQADVYAVAVSDVVADVLRGYNGTIFAYGQTGEWHSIGGIGALQSLHGVEEMAWSSSLAGGRLSPRADGKIGGKGRRPRQWHWMKGYMWLNDVRRTRRGAASEGGADHGRSGL